MDQLDPNPTRRKGFWATLAIATATGVGAVTIALPAIPASADPPPPAPGTTTVPPPGAPNPAPDAVPGPGDPVAPPPPGIPDPNAPLPPPDPNLPLPPPDPNAPPPPPPGAPVPDAGRVDNPVGGFTFVIPAGWVESDASHLDYGSALLSKEVGLPPPPGQPPAVANDTRVVLGRLDQKLYASAESDNGKAATRLASDMGEFFMPYPGTRINQETTPLQGNGVTGSASFYEVKFSDPAKPNGQIWAGVVSSTAPNAGNAGPPQRWFVVWLGTANDPVDKVGAKILAESILPWTPPPAPAAPPPPPGFPEPAPPPPGIPPPAPNPVPPAQAPAGEVAPATASAPQQPVGT